jgi:hypothetical protein
LKNKESLTLNLKIGLVIPMNEYKNMLTQYNNVKCKVSTKNTPFWHKTEDEKSVTKLLKHIFRKLALDFDVFSYLYFISIAFWALSEPDFMNFFLYDCPSIYYHILQKSHKNEALNGHHKEFCPQ